MLKKLKKIIAKVLVVLMLSCNVVAIPGVTTSITAQAKVVTPSLKESSTTLYVGYDTYKIQLKNVTKTAKVTYVSKDKSVATVSKTGVITAKSEGTDSVVATVKQSSKSYKLTIKVTVKNPYVEFTASTDYMNVSDMYSFKAVAYGMDDDVVYSVSDTSLATVSGSGKVTALSPGKIFVYADAGKKFAKIEVTIGNNTIGTFSNNITIYDDKTIWVNVADKAADEFLTVENSNKDVMDCKLGDWVDNKVPVRIKVKGVGQDRLVVSSSKSDDKLIVYVNVAEKPSEAKELTAQEVYQKCGAATVEIAATTDTYDALGSGFFIANGVVVTNYHVIKGASQLVVTTSDKVKCNVNTIIGYDEKLDLAILSVSTKNSVCLEMFQGQVAVGETIYALGSPLGLTGTMTNGMVSTSSRIIQGVDYIQISAPISPGNSGGPLVNAFGQVIGINTGSYVEGQNLNFSININELQKINTNKPITLADYYNQYKANNTVSEDPARSGDPDTCQDVPSGASVTGSITNAKELDFYHFKIDSATELSAVCQFQSLSDLQNGYMFILDSNLDVVGDEYYMNKNDLIEFTDLNLNPGDYYVVMFADEMYTGSGIPYSFKLEY